MKYLGKTGEYFEVIDITHDNCSLLKERAENRLSLLWFKNSGRVSIDGVDSQFEKDEITCLTQFHRLEIMNVESVRLIRFNKPFYCILDHDSEVGCKGILYYGSAKAPHLKPNEEELEILETAWKMLTIEMRSMDDLQLEMLQMMLKRILIICTRIFKRENRFEELEVQKSDLLRQFNFLVESNFTKLHSVSEYAELLHKSPKTISNVFRKIGDKTPLQFIQDRILLEARRLLIYSDRGVSEIGYDLGFEDIQSFSRFFKRHESLSPSDYRKKMIEGKIAN